MAHKCTTKQKSCSKAKIKVASAKWKIHGKTKKSHGKTKKSRQNKKATAKQKNHGKIKIVTTKLETHGKTKKPQQNRKDKLLSCVSECRKVHVCSKKFKFWWRAPRSQKNSLNKRRTFIMGKSLSSIFLSQICGY